MIAENREEFQIALVENILDDSDMESLYEMAFEYLMREFDARSIQELIEETKISFSPQRREHLMRILNPNSAE